MDLSRLYLNFKKNAILFFIVVLAILPRFIALDKVPVSVNADELHYLLDAKSFYLTGKDILGEVTPLDVILFHSPKSEPLQAELQYFLEIPAVGLMGFSPSNIVLPNAFLSILTVILIYLITLRLFNKNAALFAAFIAAINPWVIFLGRTTYEAGPATLFFLCVFYVLLVTRGWKILLTIPFALLAFYSYIGTKLIFLPFMFLSILYVYLYVNKRKYLKQYSILLLFSLLLTVFFVFQFKQYQISRTSEIILPSNPEIVRQVNEFRKVAVQSSFLNVFDNKFSIYSMVLTKNAFNAFSPNYLFVNADYFFMMGGQGLFYYIDAIFLAVGLVWLFTRQRKLFFFIVPLVFIVAIPQILHEPNGNGNFTPHIALVIPIFIILIGVGLDQVFSLFKQKKLSYLFVILIGTLYLVAFANFTYFYFYKFPLQDGTFELQNRILSKYISLYENKVPVRVYSTNPKLAFREFIFFTNSYKKGTVSNINNSLKENKFVLGNVSFVPCRLTELKDANPVVINDRSCKETENMKPIKIVQLKDSGTRYNIYNDKICSRFNMPRYVSGLKLSDFNIETLSPRKFCETFIISN